MPSLSDLDSFNRMRQSASSPTLVIQPIPDLPADVKERFPSMIRWESEFEAWRVQLNVVLRDLATDVASASSGTPAPIVGDDGKLYTMAVQVIAGVPAAVPVPL